MKNLFFIFFFIVLINSPSYSLDSLCKLTGVTCSKVDYENLISKNGFYYEKFKNEKYLGYVFGIKSGFVKNGKEDGTWEIYYKSGELQKKVNYKNGVMEGISEEYNKNGNILSKSTYKNGKRNGQYEKFKNDNLIVKGNYKNNKKEGLWSYTDELGKNNEKIWVSGKLKSGLFTSIRGTGGQKKNFKREGYWKELHHSEISEGHYENDERVGFWKVIESYHVYSKGEYIKGNKEGVWFKYWRKGKYLNNKYILLNKENYKNNKLDGQRLSYFRNGKINRIVNYRNGSKEGDYEIFTDYGVKCQSGTYKNNVKKIEFSLSSSFKGVEFTVSCY